MLYLAHHKASICVPGGIVWKRTKYEIAYIFIVMRIRTVNHGFEYMHILHILD
jgi:hypothetical protein